MLAEGKDGQAVIQNMKQGPLETGYFCTNMPVRYFQLTCCMLAPGMAEYDAIVVGTV